MPDTLIPIREIAEGLGLGEDDYDLYGRYTAKLKLSLIQKSEARPQGKLIMVTAITPTSYGEGKTVCSIGLAQAICRHGRRGILTSREPSLGPIFGVKGGATGGGRARVVPSHQINLHFTGDFHAITSAHNLLAAAIDAHIHHGNALDLDVNNIAWPRTLDMNDRSLRKLVAGIGGKANGVPRETGFVITAASEIMAILALATSRADLRLRLNNIVVGYDRAGNPVRAEQLGVTGAMMVVLAEALQPNLVQTLENTPAFVHAGPFGNIAHGTSSVLSQRIALGLGDYVVNESGFGADLGAEKFFDIVMPMCGHVPAAAVVIVTLKALRVQGGAADGPVQAGFPNLDRHLANIKRWGVPPVVALNRFAADSEADLQAVLDHCRAHGVEAALSEGYLKGGDGMTDLADRVVAAAASSSPDQVQPIYARSMSLEEKITTIATRVYGASGVAFKPAAKARLQRLSGLGYQRLPVCIAKTQYSFSDDPTVMGAPVDWTLTISDVTLSAGAGFVVAIAGSMMLMPGLGKVPQAQKLDVDDAGNVIGMEY